MTQQETDTVKEIIDLMKKAEAQIEKSEYYVRGVVNVTKSITLLNSLLKGDNTL